MRMLVEDDAAGAVHLKSMLELLLLEDSFLPLVMNWAAEEDWSDLLLFLLETDSLRFPSILMDKACINKSRFVQDPWALSRIVSSYIAPWDSDHKGLKVSKLMSFEKSKSIIKLTSYRIPLAAVFSVICDRTWQKIMTLGANLPSKKCVWSALQKSIVGDTKLELVTVLKKENYRVFFVRFLQQSPAESACLQCCLQVRYILDELEQFKYSSSHDRVRSTVSDNKDHINSVVECSAHLPDNGAYLSHSKVPAEFSSGAAVITAKRKGSYFFGPANGPPKLAVPGASSIAVRGGGDNLVSFATPGAPAAAAVSTTSQTERGEDYSDPLGAFALLLLETRKLHRRFFNTAGTVPPLLATQSSRLNASDFGNASHSSINSGSSVVTYKGSMESPSSHPANVPCAGPSETLRLELTATLAQTSSVHPADVETLESFFAMTFAGRLEKLLCEVERETFQHLQLRFPLFLASPEFVFLVAQEKAQESSKVRAFRCFNAYLDFVKDNNESPFLDGVAVEEGPAFDFEAHDEGLKSLVQGKLFVHHGGDEFSLHLNQFGSFCEEDDDTDDGLDPDQERPPSHPSTRESLSPSRESKIHLSPEGETLSDLYPSLSPKPPTPRPCTEDKTQLDNPCSSSAAAGHMLHSKEGHQGDRDPWGPELKEPDRSPVPCSPYMPPTTESGKAAFQVPFMVDCLSVRCCVQLSMILCSNMSVVITSHSPDLLTATMAALPLLAAPLSLSASHSLQHLGDSTETDRWWNCYLTSYHLALVTKQNSRESKDLAFKTQTQGKSKSKSKDRGSLSSSNSSGRDPKAAPLLLPSTSWLVSVRSQDLYGSQVLRDFSHSDCKFADDVCVFDLDTFSIISPHETKTSHPQHPPPSPGRLRRELLSTHTFQCYNSPAFRTLHLKTSSLLDKLRRRSRLTAHRKMGARKGDFCERGSADCHSFEDLSPKAGSSFLLGRIFEISVSEIEERESKAAAMKEVTDVSAAILRAFSHYFTAIFYHALPASVFYYPAQKVVACDLHLMHSHLKFTREKSKEAEMEDANKKQGTPSRPKKAPTDPTPPSVMHIPTFVCPVTPCAEDGSRADVQTVDSDSDREGSLQYRGQMQRPFSAAEDKDKDKDRGSTQPKHVIRSDDTASTDSKAADRRGMLPFAAAQHVEEAFSQLVVTSPAFFDLVRRHGPVLQHFRF